MAKVLKFIVGVAMAYYSYSMFISTRHAIDVGAFNLQTSYGQGELAGGVIGTVFGALISIGLIWSAIKPD